MSKKEILQKSLRGGCMEKLEYQEEDWEDLEDEEGDEKDEFEEEAEGEWDEDD